MFIYSTEITSSKIASDTPLYQRTLKAYHTIASELQGKVLEIGCGEGYGIQTLLSSNIELTVIDKSKKVLKRIHEQHPKVRTRHQSIPPLTGIPNDSFDHVISFQVIEHIKDAEGFLQEIHRVLKPGGRAFITTPNATKTVAPNPWHFKEFTHAEMTLLIQPIFDNFSIEGIEGSAYTDHYYAQNKRAVHRILKLDVFKMHTRLPRTLLKLPYEVLNRINRNKLQRKHPKLVNNITLEDYNLTPYSDKSLDLFVSLTK